MCFFLIPPTHFMSLKKLMLNLSYQRLKLFLVFCYFFTEYQFSVLHFLFFSPHKIYTTLVMSSCIDLELLSGILFVCFHLLVLLVFFFCCCCLFVSSHPLECINNILISLWLVLKMAIYYRLPFNLTFLGLSKRTSKSSLQFNSKNIYLHLKLPGSQLYMLRPMFMLSLLFLSFVSRKKINIKKLS